MFGINKLKMEKEELEHQNGELKSALDRVNNINKEQEQTITNLQLALKNHADKINYLQALLDGMQSQKLMRDRYSDDSKNY